jgi:uncharacterized metal-binding protein
MPGGAVHMRFNLTVGPVISLPVAAVAGLVLREQPLAAMAAAGVGVLIGTFGPNPDWDANSTLEEEGKWRAIPVVGRFLYAFVFWLRAPYAALFRHRGISHIVLIGTLTRLIYLALMTVVLNLIYMGWIAVRVASGALPPQALQTALPEGGLLWMAVAVLRWAQARPGLALGVLIGILVCDLIHQLLDRYYPNRLLRRVRRYL